MKHDFKDLYIAAKVAGIYTLQSEFARAEHLQLEMLDFNESVHKSELNKISQFLMDSGVEEFTVSSGWSGTTEFICFMLDSGWQIEGTTYVKTGVDLLKDVPILEKAIKFIRKK